MKRLFAWGWIAWLSTFCWSCEVKTIKEAGYDVEAIQEEMKLRKVKRITPAQFVAWVDEHSASVVVALNRRLEACMHQHPLADCKEQIRPYADSLAAVHGFRYEFLTLKDLQSKHETASTEQEKQLWLAYLYDMEQGHDLQTNVQFIKERKEYWYTAPVVFYEDAESNAPIALWLLVFPQKEIVKRFN
jgi:hypothetical protein